MVSGELVTCRLLHHRGMLSTGQGRRSLAGVYRFQNFGIAALHALGLAGLICPHAYILYIYTQVLGFYLLTPSFLYLSALSRPPPLPFPIRRSSSSSAALSPLELLGTRA